MSEMQSKPVIPRPTPPPPYVEEDDLVSRLIMWIGFGVLFVMFGFLLWCVFSF